LKGFIMSPYIINSKIETQKRATLSPTINTMNVFSG